MSGLDRRSGLGERDEALIDGNVLNPEPSPHGFRIAYGARVDGAWSIYVSNLDGRGEARDRSGKPRGDFNPRWSPNGNDLAFLRDVTGDDNDLYVVHADGTELRRVTDTPDRLEFWPSWVPDGTEVMVTTGEGPQRIVAIRLADGAERPVGTTPRAPFVETFDDGIRDASLWHEILDSGPRSASPGSTRDGDPRKRDAGRPVEPGRGALGAAMHGRRRLRCPGRLRAARVAHPGGFHAGLNAIYANASIERHSAPWAPGGDGTISWVEPNAGPAI